jgi:hypothetical protein
MAPRIDIRAAASPPKRANKFALAFRASYRPSVHPSIHSSRFLSVPSFSFPHDPSCPVLSNALRRRSTPPPSMCSLACETSPRFALSSLSHSLTLSLSLSLLPRILPPHPSVSPFQTSASGFFSSLRPTIFPHSKLRRTRVNTCARASDGRERARMTYAERISLLYILRAAVRRNLRRCRRHSSPTYPPMACSFLRLPSFLTPLSFSLCSSLPARSRLLLIIYLSCLAPLYFSLPLFVPRRRHWSLLVCSSETDILLSTLMFRSGLLCLLFFFS